MKRRHEQAHASRPITLLLSSMALPAATALALAARRRGWQVATMDRDPPPSRESEIVFYGSTLEVKAAEKRYDLALLEPPLDLLARLPFSLLLRRVTCCRWGDVGDIDRPISSNPLIRSTRFSTPASIAIAARFAVKRSLRRTPLLAAEPVEWLAEYRCFVLDGAVMATSPYLSFGRPLQHRIATANILPTPVMDLCRRLCSLGSMALPPAFVVDVGLIEDRGWAVVEFNPVWWAGLLSADAVKAMDVLRRSCRRRRDLGPEDRPWVVKRGGRCG